MSQDSVVLARGNGALLQYGGRVREYLRGPILPTRRDGHGKVNQLDSGGSHAWEP